MSKASAAPKASGPAEPVKPSNFLRGIIERDLEAGTYAGRVARINPSTQAGSRAVSVYLAIDPHPALRQGLFARGSVVLEERQALWLPASAVRLDRALPYVIALEGGKLSARNVRTGLRSRGADGERVEIVDGLAEGAQVLAGSIATVAEGAAWRMSGATGPASKSPAVRASAVAPGASR